MSAFTQLLTWSIPHGEQRLSYVSVGTRARARRDETWQRRRCLGSAEHWLGGLGGCKSSPSRRHATLGRLCPFTCRTIEWYASICRAPQVRRPSCDGYVGSSRLAESHGIDTGFPQQSPFTAPSWPNVELHLSLLSLLFYRLLSGTALQRTAM